ncbi:MAG: DUF4838 domain-containing protein [Armatimonadota bacterium]
MIKIFSSSLASKATVFAVGELKKYLQSITSQEVVSTEDIESAEIIINIDLSLFPEEFHLKKHQKLTINGGSGRGCLYGVYNYLHQLGCRWALPGKEYEKIPKLNDYKNIKETVSKPAVNRRGIVYCVKEPYEIEKLTDFIDYLCKNGFNYLFLHQEKISEDKKTIIAEELNIREMGFEWGGHLLPSFLPRELFDNNPDYFRLEKGKRVKDWNYCPLSTEANDIIAKNAQKTLNSFDIFDRFETFHIWPDDLFGGGWCEMNELKGWTDSDQYLLALNELSKRLVLKDTKLSYCAYHTHIYPPTKLKADSHIRLMFAPRERSYLTPIGEGEANKRYMKYLNDLMRVFPVGAEVFEYYQDCILFRYLPLSLHRVIGEDVKRYLAAGIDGISSLFFDTFSNWAYGLNTYILGKALWNGKTDENDIINYCKDIYGHAANEMIKYFDMLFELVAFALDTNGYSDFTDLRIPQPQKWARVHADRLAPLVSGEHLYEIEENLIKAIEISDEPYKTRIKEQKFLWDYTKYEIVTLYLGHDIGNLILSSLADTASKDEMNKVIKRLEEIIDRIKEGTELIKKAPHKLRGDIASFQENGSLWERNTLYIDILNSWISYIKQKVC